jgi:hypothetical protein
MFLLLSSCATKRYRDDILRCLAAPTGTQIQFRYREKIVGESVKRALDKVRGSKGVVCNVDIDVKLDATGIHPLTPVRSVTIDRAWLTGSTISINMTMGDFAYAEDTVSFTTQISQQAGGQTPANARADSEAGGLWFFRVPDQPDTLRLHGDIGTFELITEQLGGISHFKEEPFFWTVLGLRRGSADLLEDTGRTDPWPDRIDFDRTYTLLVYVFRPIDTAWPNSIGQLILTSELTLTSVNSPNIVVDSPYDLKRWSFKVQRPGLAFRDSSWLRIGQETARENDLKGPGGREDLSLETINRELRRRLNGSLEWEIDLPLRFRLSWLRVVWINCVLGALLSGPSILVIWRQTGVSDTSKVGASSFALLFGLAAAIVATFQVKRIV